jgi:integrase
VKLAAFLATVYLPSRIEVSADYAQNLAAVVARFSAHMGRPAKLADLTEQNVAGYLSAYRQKWSATSTNNQRRMLLTLWAVAFDHMLLPNGPRARLIRRLPEEHDPPEAWDAEQIGRLFATVTELRGNVGTIARSAWWTTLLLATFYTGCRIGALAKTPVANYRARTILVRGQKTKKTQLYQLPENCCDAIDATEPWTRQLLWPWPHCRRHLFTEMRKICEAAGIPAPTINHSLFHKLRRTTLSMCAAVDPAIAQRQANHASYATTLASYIDPRLSRGLSAADVLPNPLAPSRPTLRIYA